MNAHTSLFAAIAAILMSAVTVGSAVAPASAGITFSPLAVQHV